MTRPIAVGDLHGRLDLLDALLERYPDRDLVFLGDYVDRGPDVPGVLRRVRQLVADGRAVALWGNHDKMLCEVVLDQWHTGYWQQQYANHTISQYADEPTQLFGDLQWMRVHLQHWLVVGDVYLSHGAPHQAGQAQPFHPHEAFEPVHLWGRPGDHRERLPEGCVLAVHGHTPVQTMTEDKRRTDPITIDYGPTLGLAYYIDSGAFRSGVLGIFDLETRQAGTVTLPTPEPA